MEVGIPKGATKSQIEQMNRAVKYTKEHSVDSFTQQEILNYVPEGDRTKGGKCDTWEQKGRK